MRIHLMCFYIVVGMLALWGSAYVLIEVCAEPHRSWIRLPTVVTTLLIEVFAVINGTEEMERGSE